MFLDRATTPHQLFGRYTFHISHNRIPTPTTTQTIHDIYRKVATRIAVDTLLR
jgi:hypothetical protein